MPAMVPPLTPEPSPVEAWPRTASSVAAGAEVTTMVDTWGSPPPAVTVVTNVDWFGVDVVLGGAREDVDVGVGEDEDEDESC